MFTEKVFHNDRYVTSLQAKIISVEKKNKKMVCITDRTVFYPEGGGQPGDIGELTLLRDGAPVRTYAVIDTKEEKDGEGVLHILAEEDAALAVGDTVLLTIDWENRFINMQRHAGEHLLTATIYNRFHGINKGFHMGSDAVTIDIDLGGEIMTEAMLTEAEELANEKIWENIPINVEYYPNKDEAAKRPSRKPITMDGEISLVVFGDYDHPYDCCPCCGTHPNTTGEIGAVHIYKAEPNKGMTRIYFDCGRRALHHSREEHRILTEVANRYSVAPEKLLARLEKREEEQRVRNDKLAVFTKRILALEAEALQGRVTEDTALLTASYEDFDTEDVQKLAFTAQELIEKKDLLLALTHAPSHTLFLVSDGTIPCGDLIKKHAKDFGGKGGGRPEQARARFEDTSGIENFLREIHDKYF